MVEYLHLLRLANQQERPLNERIGLLDVLATTREYMDNDARQQYERIRAEVTERIRALCEPTRAPRG